MRLYTWGKLCVGVVTVLLAAMPGLAAAETESKETAAPDAPAISVTESSKWAAPTVQFGSYAAYATLQALDVVSTLRALKTPGAYEANPMYAGTVDSR